MLLNSVCSLLSLSPRINVFCISGHLSGSLSFLASDWSQSPSPGFWLADTGHLLRWGLCSSTTCLIVDMTQINWRVRKLAGCCKMKIRTRITTPSWFHSPLLRLSVSNCTSAWPYFDHTERKKSLRRSVLWLPPCVINQSSIVNYHYLETLTIRSHAAVLININQSQPPRVFPLRSVRACVMLMYFLPSPESPPPN